MLERDYSRLMNCIETIDHMLAWPAALAELVFLSIEKVWPKS